MRALFFILSLLFAVSSLAQQEQVIYGDDDVYLSLRAGEENKSVDCISRTAGLWKYCETRGAIIVRRVQSNGIYKTVFSIPVSLALKFEGLALDIKTSPQTIRILGLQNINDIFSDIYLGATASIDVIVGNIGRTTVENAKGVILRFPEMGFSLPGSGGPGLSYGMVGLGAKVGILKVKIIRM